MNTSTLPKHRWTTEEDDILRECYRSGGGLLCAKVLDRSTDSIRSRAFVLGLKAPRSAFEKDILCTKANP